MICKNCGIFFYRKKNEKYCSEKCRKEVRRRYDAKRYEESKKEVKKHTLDDTLAMLKDKGMTYAEYQMMKTKEMMYGDRP